MPTSPASMNVMLSAAGRRVSLMRAAEASIQHLGLAGTVLAMDLNLSSSAMQLAADRVVVPPYRDPKCIDVLVDLAYTYPLQLIVPTIDTELAFYSQHAPRFREAGCCVHISSPETIQIGSDKQKTHEWLASNGFPVVTQWTLEQALDVVEQLAFPLIVKPRFGSSSVGLTIARQRQHLEARADEKNLIVQTIALGQEYTVDVYVDQAGKCRCAVPRRRMETRAGEVSKGITSRHPRVSDLARRVAEALPRAWGTLNIQIFHDARTDQLWVIELNPRFGGGYPLSHAAGAHMIQWVMEEAAGLPCSARDDQWEDGLVMLRYDEAVFVRKERLETP